MIMFVRSDMIICLRKIKPELYFLLVDVLQPGVTQGLDSQPAHHLLHLGGEDGQGGEDRQQDPVCT